MAPSNALSPDGVSCCHNARDSTGRTDHADPHGQEAAVFDPARQAARLDTIAIAHLNPSCVIRPYYIITSLSRENDFSSFAPMIPGSYPPPDSLRETSLPWVTRPERDAKRGASPAHTLSRVLYQITSRHMWRPPCFIHSKPRCLIRSQAGQTWPADSAQADGATRELRAEVQQPACCQSKMASGGTDGRTEERREETDRRLVIAFSADAAGPPDVRRRRPRVYLTSRRCWGTCRRCGGTERPTAGGLGYVGRKGSTPDGARQLPSQEASLRFPPSQHLSVFLHILCFPERCSFQVF
nr:unnamed protein product [Digitaria exilis]